jgi:hypothetical protein
MKRALEAALVLAVLALGAFFLRQAAVRRGAGEAAGGNPALRAGSDGAPYAEKPKTGVELLPMLQLTRPAKPSRRPAAVPSPAAP